MSAQEKDEIKAARLTGYSRGYVAGRRKGQEEQALAVSSRRRSDSWNAAFVALLPFAMEHGKGWKIGEREVSNSRDRIDLAALWADHALEKMK